MTDGLDLPLRDRQHPEASEDFNIPILIQVHDCARLGTAFIAKSSRTAC